MTPREIDKRLDALEHVVLPFAPPPVWVSFGGGAPAGWKFKDQIVRREPDESDDALRERVVSAAGPLFASGETQVYIAIHEV